MYSLSKSFRSLIGFALLLGLLTPIENQGQVRGEDVKLLFEVKYNAWRDWLRENKPPTPSSIIYMDDLYDNEPYKEIVKLGVPAIPYIIEKQQEDRMLGYALYQITKWKYHIKRKGEKPSEFVWTVEEFPDIRQKDGPPDSRRLWLRWWKEGRKLTEQRFEKLHREWQELKKQEKDEQAKKKYQRIIDLGIAALPSITQKIEQGDTDLIPVVSELTDNKVKNNAKKTEYLDCWKKNKENWLIPFPNKKPTANAGLDQTVTSGDIIKLDGSASSDEDKDALIFQWKQIAGPSVNIANADSPTPSFKAPEVSKKTVLTFQLIVDDSKNACPTPNSESEPATVKITVNPIG